MKTQHKYRADPKATQEIRAFVREYEERFNKGDAAALAALLTEDAVQMAPEGPICGRQAIQKKYADLFEQSHPTDIICTVDRGMRSATFHGIAENGVVLFRARTVLCA